eukprot:CAMPEP_0114548926 /NCGR_PEP_ID=MMETSP0114-20121206/5249_1 /TAXON_ID=31324 /ORGANISM="Goniomonas sp, Strain m" /LENGTH=309 /DNA_ID=CAMNT_0001733563 /DNA_START=9 /DNA_END=938 /DNA_ORIENTATION=-
MADTGNCGACDKPIAAGGKVMKAMDKRWHPECFKCAKCQQAITGTFGKGGDGLPICGPCLDEIEEARPENDTCFGCEKLIDPKEKVITAMEKRWHPACFVCVKCSGGIEGTFARDDAGKPICATCLEKEEGPTPAKKEDDLCGGCEKPISGKITRALDRRWHADCFVCQKCTKPIVGNFMNIGGKPCCSGCSDADVSSECGGCSKPIGGKVLTALDKNWHVDCFKCKTCGGAVPAQFEHADGFPYCNDCWSKDMIPKCGICSKNLEGEITRVGDERYHPECFTCSKCSIKLGAKFFSLEGKYLCETCAS